MVFGNDEVQLPIDEYFQFVGNGLKHYIEKAKCGHLKNDFHNSASVKFTAAIETFGQVQLTLSDGFKISELENAFFLGDYLVTKSPTKPLLIFFNCSRKGFLFDCTKLTWLKDVYLAPIYEVILPNHSNKVYHDRIALAVRNKHGP